MKKIICIFCSVLICLSIIPITASASSNTEIPDCLSADMFPDYLRGYLNQEDSLLLLVMRDNDFQVLFGWRVSLFYNHVYNRVGIGYGSSQFLDENQVGSFVYTNRFSYDGEALSEWAEYPRIAGVPGSTYTGNTYWGRYWWAPATTSSTFIILNGHSCDTFGARTPNGTYWSYLMGVSLYSCTYYQVSGIFKNQSNSSLGYACTYYMGNNAFTNIQTHITGAGGTCTIDNSTTIKTIEEQQLNTSKGIWESIKGIPQLIADKIKSLFIPSDGFFSSYVTSLRSFFSDRFGFLYEMPAALYSILQQLVSYNPRSSGYSIHFPTVSTPEVVDGSIVWHEIISERNITFEFLSQSPFSTLYTGYRGFIWLAYCFSLLNLAIRKFDDIFGGGGN